MEPDWPGLPRQSSRAICYLYSADNQSDQQPTGHGDGEVHSRPEEERFVTNHCEPCSSNSISDTSERIGGRAVQPTYHAHRRHISVSMDCVRWPAFQRLAGGRGRARRIDVEPEDREHQRNADRRRNVVFRGRRDRRGRRNYGELSFEHPNHADGPYGESGPILEPAAGADSGFTGQSGVHAQS